MKCGIPRHVKYKCHDGATLKNDYELNASNLSLQWKIMMFYENWKVCSNGISPGMENDETLLED